MAAGTYTTIQGDAWDAIAHKVYGDEKYTGWLMQHNLPLLDTFVFSAGTVLQTPSVPEDDDVADAPIWRSSE
jgi:phage tail protein X